MTEAADAEPRPADCYRAATPTLSQRVLDIMNEPLTSHVENKPLALAQEVGFSYAALVAPN
ncbi:MAG: hypothetical protein M3518_07205 [Actinomycetota bacterium]|nr:hypothetical protein [Actinomycetota bacterium]